MSMATSVYFSTLSGTPCRRQRFRACCNKPDEGNKEIKAADAIRKSLGELSKQQGRLSDKVNVVFDGNTSGARWKELDKKVNYYPSQRTFTAIGYGGEDFVDSMVSVVEEHLGPVHVECISQRESSNGNYLSVRVGPVWVQTAEQVVQVYTNMREDKRVKWCL